MPSFESKSNLSIMWLGVQGFREVKIVSADRPGLIREKAGSNEPTLTALLLYSADHTVHMTA